jgi:hypothetical protein
MLALLTITIAAAVVALVLGVVGVRRVGRFTLVAEVAMLVAMVDVHVPGLGVVPAPFWALALGGCALGTALVDRLRRASRPDADHLHALGMLLGAGFVLLDGTASHGVVASGATHVHSVVAHGAVVLLPLAVAVVVHAGIVAHGLLGRRLPRVEAARRAASLASLLAMGAMVVVH